MTAGEPDAQGDGLLIIGASQAGVQLAVSLRALGYEPPITLLGEENHRPYQRPALSKEFLQNQVTKESLMFRTAEYWAEHRIHVVQDERIVRLERTDAEGRGVAVTRRGSRIAFDRVAFTLGARPRRLHIDGVDHPAVLYLRNADDALELKARVPAAKNVVVIGGGFIGLEAASSLTTLGKSVTVVEAGPRLLGRAVGEQTADFVLRHHRASGTRVVLDAVVTRIVARGDTVTGVEVNGEIVDADIVLIGIGVIPNTELAEGFRLDCENGIVVDRRGVASDGHSIAVGDVANLPTPVAHAAPGQRVRFESVNNAVEQAKIAAFALAGRDGEYPGVPWFWSNQGELKLQIAGLSDGHDHVVVRDRAHRGAFSVLYYRGDTLLAVDAINSPLDFLAVKSALGAAQTIPAADAGDPDVRLSLLTQAA